MIKWDFKINSDVQEIIKKLNAAFGTADDFVFKIDNGKNDSATFTIHKRRLYAFYLMFTNKIIVNGKILKTATENETHLEISFTQYFLWKLIIFTHLFLGLGFLIARFSGIGSSAYMYILGDILLGVGIVLWIVVQEKFEKDIQDYKTLISEVLKS